MMATKELQVHLEKRLQKQNEATASPMRRLHGERLGLSSIASAPVSPATPRSTAATAELLQRIQVAERQRDEALQRLQQIQMGSVKTGREAAAEIARLRMETQEVVWFWGVLEGLGE